jgi:hypothetical protein
MARSRRYFESFNTNNTSFTSGCDRVGFARNELMPAARLGFDFHAGSLTAPFSASSPWYLVATEDKMIPPDAQRAMSKRARYAVTTANDSSVRLRDGRAFDLVVQPTEPDKS